MFSWCLNLRLSVDNFLLEILNEIYLLRLKLICIIIINVLFEFLFSCKLV